MERASSALETFRRRRQLDDPSYFNRRGLMYGEEDDENPLRPALPLYRGQNNPFRSFWRA